MSQEAEVRLHAFVEGQVQGVGFRMFVLGEAQRLGVNGWVRNTWDGEVEALAEGPRAALEGLLDRLRRGPRGATVINVRFDWEIATGEFESFEVRNTH